MFFSSFGGFSSLFQLVPLLAGGVFLLASAIIVLQLVRGAARWQQNNRSPVLTVEAAVVSKRSEVHHHHPAGAGPSHIHSSSRYYATFEMESGDRIELPLSGKEYGLLAEADHGRLTFQGTRYLGFERYI